MKYELINKIIGYRITQILDKTALYLEIRAKSIFDPLQVKAFVNRIQKIIDEKGHFDFANKCGAVRKSERPQTDETFDERMPLNRLVESPNLKIEPIIKEVYHDGYGAVFAIDSPVVAKYLEALKWYESLPDKEKEYVNELSPKSSGPACGSEDDDESDWDKEPAIVTRLLFM